MVYYPFLSLSLLFVMENACTMPFTATSTPEASSSFPLLSALPTHWIRHPACRGVHYPVDFGAGCFPNILPYRTPSEPTRYPSDAEWALCAYENMEPRFYVRADTASDDGCHTRSTQYDLEPSSPVAFPLDVSASQPFHVCPTCSQVSAAPVFSAPSSAPGVASVTQLSPGLSVSPPRAPSALEWLASVPPPPRQCIFSSSVLDASGVMDVFGECPRCASVALYQVPMSFPAGTLHSVSRSWTSSPYPSSPRVSSRMKDASTQTHFS